MASIIKNTSALFIAHFIVRVISFGLLILLPRYLNEIELGAYFWAAAFTNMMVIFAELGMQTPLIREITIAPAKAQIYISNALAMRLILSVITLAMMVSIANLFGSPQETVQIVYILGLSEIVYSIAQIFRSTFRAFEEMKFEALVVLTERVLVILPFIIIKKIGGNFFYVGGGTPLLEFNLKTFCITILTARVVHLFLSFGIMEGKFAQLSFKLSLGFFKILLLQSLPFAMGNIFNLIYFRIDTVMLARLSPYGQSAVAWYGLAYGLVIALTIIPGAYMGAVFPVMSKALKKRDLGQSDFQVLYTRAFKLMFILALPISLGLALLTENVVSLFWPRAIYSTSTIDPALNLLSWAGGLIFLNTVLTTVLRAADKRATFTTLMGTGLAFNILLNLYLIPRYSHRGAAIAMVLTEVYLFIFGFTYISTKLTKLNQFSFVFKSAIAALCMGVLLWLLRDKFSIFFLIPIAGLVYVGIMALWYYSIKRKA
ncbi:TPA: flippase [Candidatus Poribacteria bacterium]|nr:flippase [Candidatus Poribacteria bacterium]